MLLDRELNIKTIYGKGNNNMLYLINGSDLDDNGNPIKLLKIGFTKNLDQREKSYKSMGNFSGFIETRNGDKKFRIRISSLFQKIQI